MFVYVWRAPPLQNITPYTLSYRQNFVLSVEQFDIKITSDTKRSQLISRRMIPYI